MTLRALPYALGLAALAAALALPWLRAKGRRGVVALVALTVLCVGAVLLGARFDVDAWLPLRAGRPWMLALGGLLALALSANESLREPAHRRDRLHRALLAIGVLGAALAASRPERAHRDDRLAVVIVEDRSRSMDQLTGAADRARALESEALPTMRDADRIGRVVFGVEARVEDPLHGRETPSAAQRVPVGRDGTDLEAAVRRALGEIPDDSAGRIVLVTDGASNRGDALSAAAAAAAAGVPLDVVMSPPRPTLGLRVESMRGPSRVAEGESFEMRVVTRASEAFDAEVRVFVDGSLRHRGRVRVAAGEDVHTLRETAPASGLHRYEVELVPRDASRDPVVADNRAGHFLRVRGPSSVLVLEGDPGASTPFADALRDGGFRVVERGTHGVPDDLAELATYDLVVLSDVPARAFSPTQLEAFRTYVRDLGGGLVLMGGDRSMGPGGYARTPVEDISPVTFDLRQERRRASLAEVISIDYSGSMAAVVGGFTKLALANEAAARSALLLGRGDHLGVNHVDTDTRWTIPLAPITEPDEVLRRIRAVSVGGGGIIMPIALRDGYAALRREQTNLRHLLIFADGDDAEDIMGCATTVAAAYREGITTSVVSLGRGNDTPELEHLGREGHGRFYLVEDALRLPTVFAQETILATRASLREESFVPAVSAPDAMLAGIDFAHAPPLRGYVVTVPRPRAAVLLRGPDDDPVLAWWQVGVGHVAAFTSDAKDRWGAQWLPWPAASRLWVSMARAMVRRDDGDVRAEADTEGGVLHVRASATDREGRADALRRLSVTIVGPDNATTRRALDPSGGGGYATELPLQRSGAYTLTVVDDALGVPVTTAGALLLDGEELRPPRDPDLLERVRATTRGRWIRRGDELFAQRGARRAAWSPVGGFLAWLSLASLVLSVVLRRFAWPRAHAARADEAPLRASAGVAALLARRGVTVAPFRREPTPATATARRATVDPEDVDAPVTARSNALDAMRARRRQAKPAPAPRAVVKPAATPRAPTAATGPAVQSLLSRKRDRRTPGVS